jgi:hypothetical protein
MISILIMSLFCSLLFSQSIFWEEDFTSLPSGWTIESNWAFSGGALVFSWTPTVQNYDLSAISPTITLPVNVGDLIVSQYVENYSAVDEMVEIGIIHDGFTTVLWDYQITNGNWGSTGGEELVLSLNEFASEEVQLSFRSYGTNTYNINFWYIYEAAISSLYNNDLTAVEVIGPVIAELNQPDIWKVAVKNCGLQSQDSYVVKLFDEDGSEIGMIEVFAPIAPLQTVEHSFQWTPAELGETHLYGEVIFSNDEMLNNNITPMLPVSIFPEGERQYLVWDNDNSSHYTDPNTGAIKNSEEGILDALTANGINYQLVTELPAVLRNYDVVFICLGLYCVG